MAHILKRVGNQANYQYQYFECDTVEDMNNLDVRKVPMGSECLVTGNGNRYNLNGSKQWKLVYSHSDSGGGSDDGNTYYDGGEELPPRNFYDGGEET